MGRGHASTCPEDGQGPSDPYNHHPVTRRRSLVHEPQPLRHPHAGDHAARRRPGRRAERPAHRPQRRSRRARPDDQPRLHRPPRLRRGVRQALRRHAGSQDRAPARHQLRVGRRPALGGHQAAPRREVPRRRAVQRRGGEVQHRAPHQHAGLVPQDRDRSDPSVDVLNDTTVRLNLSEPLVPLLGGADRPRRHDGLAQGGQGARRQVRHPPGLRRALPVRRARGSGQDRLRAVPRLLGQGQHPHRPGGVRADPRLHRAPGQPALGRPAHDRARLAHRPAGDPRRTAGSR